MRVFESVIRRRDGTIPHEGEQCDEPEVGKVWRFMPWLFAAPLFGNLCLQNWLFG